MEEKKTIRKWFWVWEFEKEDRWLNRMASEGWVLDQVGFCKYVFKKGEPGAYTIRLQMYNPDRDMDEFMEEMGIEKVGQVFKWVFYRKKTDGESFELFSDVDSAIRHLNNISRMLLAIALLNIGVGTHNIIAIHSWIPLINLLCGTVLMYGLGRLHERKAILKQEHELVE